jgi:hypothetical protein
VHPSVIHPSPIVDQLDYSILKRRDVILSLIHSTLLCN